LHQKTFFLLSSLHQHLPLITLLLQEAVAQGAQAAEQAALVVAEQAVFALRRGFPLLRGLQLR
jgi:hypothetical protein